MKVSGFTFIRNAIQYDYPIVEAIRSILPLCDEMIVCVGNSVDETTALIEGMNDPKIKIQHSTWNDSLKKGGAVLADETNKAKSFISPDSSWAFYIQGDEVVHEKYIPKIREAMEKYANDPKVEGLLFRYLHFYGSYDYVGDSRTWYSHEIRIIRNDPSINSYRDAQGFRKDGRKLNVKSIDAYIYHYGWVKHPKDQLIKTRGFEKLYHETSAADSIGTAESQGFDYSGIDSLTLFSGTHPKVMQERIRRKNWHFEYDITRKNFGIKLWILHKVEKITGKRLFDYRNYRVLR